MSSERQSSQGKKRYAVVGTGVRSRAFVEGMVKDHADHASLVAFCDQSPTRMNWFNEYLNREYGFTPVPIYSPDQFETMLSEQQVDTVLVTTTDATHHEYCIRAMEAGCDVICEKPLTTDAAKAQAILEAMKRTGKDLRVTFNLRYNPKMRTVKSLLRKGVIGRPLAVNFRYVLDTRHGADYYRRWHASREHSGGLLLHKSTHHFDIVNWLLEDWPETVVGMGGLQFYGKANAEARGEQYSYDRYTSDVPGARRDPFSFPLDGDEWSRRLYRDAEAETGYIRDRNVFGEHVDIEDVMNVLIRFRGGALLNYSLLTFAPWEGFELAVTGTKGRVELVHQNQPHVVDEDGNSETIEDAAEKASIKCTVYPMFGESYEAPIEKLEGGHGGSDPIMRAALFSPTPPADELHCAAGVDDGIASILCGIAANESMSRGSQPIACDDLVALPAHPSAAGDRLVGQAKA